MPCTSPRVRFCARRAPILLALMLLGACGGGGTRPMGSPDVITRQEIEQYLAAGTPHLYELIQRARPRWLESRGDRSLALETSIVVYQNQSKLGSLDVLRELKLDNVVRIRHLDSARAGLLPGARDQHVEAAIVVETGVGGPDPLH
jgi:hypothetical protein